MSLQTATPGRFLRDPRFQLVDIRLRAVELGRDCAGLEKRKIQRRAGAAYTLAPLSSVSSVFIGSRSPVQTHIGRMELPEFTAVHIADLFEEFCRARGEIRHLE
jgi:hypothetical protein